MLKLFFQAFFSEDSKQYTLVEETFAEHEKCGLVNVFYLWEPDPILSIKKNSPYKEIISVKWVFGFLFLNLSIFFWFIFAVFFE